MTAPIFILAGEASGDVLGSRIMRAINTNYGNQKWVGLGGDHMTAEGLQNIGEMHRLSIIGVGDSFKNYIKLSEFCKTLVDYVIVERPQLILTIDAKGFRYGLRIGCGGACGRRVVSNYSHSCADGLGVGMWRRHKFARVFDGMLCLFPFEPDYFTPLGLDCHFIGHPAVLDVQPKSPAEKPLVDTPRIAILPGSRMSEIRHILPIMLSSVELLRGRFPQTDFTLPAVPQLKTNCSDL